MTDRITITTDEALLKRMQDAMREYGPIIGQKAFKKSLDSGVKQLIESMKSFVPTRTGRLRNAFTKKSTTKYRPIFWKESVAMKIGSSRSDPTGAYYWRMVDRGHALVVNKKQVGSVPAVNFVEKGARAVAQSIINDLSAKTISTVNDLWSKQK